MRMSQMTLSILTLLSMLLCEIRFHGNLLAIIRKICLDDGA